MVVALAWAAPGAQAQDGDVFLIVSLEPTFDTSIGGEDFGSPVIVVRIGTLTGGVETTGDTRFLPEEEPPPVPLEGEIDLEDLDGNESTIFGSFETEPLGSEEEGDPHMVTPLPVDIHPDIQAAVFAASPALAAAAEADPFMSTGQIANLVAGYLGEGSEVTLTQIAEAIFGTNVVLETTDENLSCEAEGELFPHQPKLPPLFAFEFAFDEDGEFTALDVCLLVEAEVKEASINLSKKGSMSVAIYSSDTFDSDDIDEETVEIGGVFATDVTFAANKATCKFDVDELVEEGVLTEDTTHVTIRARLSDGSCIEATIPINVK